jgi:hypothetical protein
MGKKFFLCCAVFLLGLGVCGAVYAQSLDAMTNIFYQGLIPIIERNMNNPSQCLSEVDQYYVNNKALIEKIKAKTGEAMKQMAPMMEKYMAAVEDSMSGKQIDEGQFKNFDQSASGSGSVSPIVRRYTKLIEQFTAKHPRAGGAIAMKAMELLPMDNLFNFEQMMPSQ